ncbi:DUF6286 domain-containing protein [Flexivirga meconopsidis]|jgi:hypothetical protein|uniref:DUF6286 domain-containing protein n=1 Tax=Flexivirga meconopsidis TaxID=2977121 RepID=UPI00223F0B8F|nr:DUF6286 domain-containing protein [Flexivirga meconopsidis]
MSKLPPPQARPAAAYTAALLALGLIGLGVVGVQELLTRQDWVSGKPWLSTVIDNAQHATPASWALPAGIAAVVVGLMLLFAAVKPRRATHRRVPGTDDAWVSPAALATIAAVAARRTPGVVSADARHTRRRIQVSVQADADRQLDGMDQAVQRQVESQLEGLSDMPISVRSRQVTR